jgi:hypothetical protein
MAMTTKIDFSFVEDMKTCEQMPGLSVLAHGLLVQKHYRDLIGHIRDGAPLALEWRLPEWVHDPEILSRIFDDAVMDRYIVHHDCGKPRCLTIDEDGRRHFPGHASASREVWLEAGGDMEAAELIGMDMDVHLLKEEGVTEFAARPQAIALLVTGLSEIHANADLFGGISSVGFKMKWKQIDKRGRSILRRFKN